MPAPAQAELPLDSASGAASLQEVEPGRWPVASGWQPLVDAFWGSAEGQGLSAFLRERLAAGAVVYPPQPLRALELTPPETIRAVVLGQDPYHGPGQAEGLAFSVAEGVRLPPSLRNIFREAGLAPATGSLAGWARSGVLLLNSSLTVEAGQPGSHAGRGWEALSGRILRHVASTASPCVYFLWGAHAQASAGLIEEAARRHGRACLLLAANHPSPLSARRPPVPFLGCGHFVQARQWLRERGVQPPF